MTLDEALKRHRGMGPGFHLLRHLLSFIIVAHHCRVAVVGPTVDEAHVKGALFGAVKSSASAAAPHVGMTQIVIELMRPGLFALVAMFFALSGFLVTGSALRSKGIKTFFANRALRILPALSVEVTLSALVLGPLVTTLPLADYFTDHQFWRYFGNVVGEVTFTLPGVFTGNPWSGMVNANLWTLPPEFWCYFLMMVMMTIGLLTRHRYVTMAVLAALAALLVAGLFYPDRLSIRNDTTHFTSWYIVMMFMFGAVFFLNASRIPLHPALFLACAAAYYLLTLFDRLGPISGVFLTYCMVYIGMMPFAWFDRILKLDVSYGTYLYGFPITQALIYFLVPHLGALSPYERFAIILPLVFLLTMLFSVVSWTYIEKPALRLRKHVLREPPRAPSADTASSVA